MFHTFVISSSGNIVDFDRASYLMDRDLYRRALQEMWRQPSKPARRRSSRTIHLAESAGQAQIAWNAYCRLHRERYGEPFVADANPTWDRGNQPSRPPSADLWRWSADRIMRATPTWALDEEARVHPVTIARARRRRQTR